MAIINVAVINRTRRKTRASCAGGYQHRIPTFFSVRLDDISRLSTDADRTRSISRHELPYAALLCLFNQHHELSHLQCTLGDHSRLSRVVRQTSPNLRTLDVEFVDSDHREAVNDVVSIFNLLGNTLERLSLGHHLTHSEVEIDFSRELELAFQRLLKQSSGSGPVLPKLRALTLRALDLSDLFKPLSNIVDPTNLTRLNLASCNSIITFFSDLALSNHQPLKLQHLGLDCSSQYHEPVSEDEVTTAIDYLRDVTASPALQSLHIAGPAWVDAHRLLGPISLMKSRICFLSASTRTKTSLTLLGWRKVSIRNFQLCSMLHQVAKLFRISFHGKKRPKYHLVHPYLCFLPC
jgi:hypothetical protein